tara:strand:+ start:15 stop:1142 length:1128 start_codon:yes stop_codon:yes gene_type:complete
VVKIYLKINGGRVMDSVVVKTKRKKIIMPDDFQKCATHKFTDRDNAAFEAFKVAVKNRLIISNAFPDPMDDFLDYAIQRKKIGSETSKGFCIANIKHRWGNEQQGLCGVDENLYGPSESIVNFYDDVTKGLIKLNPHNNRSQVSKNDNWDLDKKFFNSSHLELTDLIEEFKVTVRRIEKLFIPPTPFSKEKYWSRILFTMTDDKNIYTSASEGLEYSNLKVGDKILFTAKIKKHEFDRKDGISKINRLHLQGDLSGIVLIKKEKEKKTRRSYDEPERSQAGNNVKKYNGFKCQVCEALGQNPISFLKRDGQPYAEAHHINPLGEGGDDTEDNIVSICANHHRQIHLGDVSIPKILEDKFIIIMDGKELSLKRWRT